MLMKFWEKLKISQLLDRGSFFNRAQGHFQEFMHRSWYMHIFYVYFIDLMLDR